ncbi:BatD family protein [uncultured Vibrio sp.]|uniref:BatD family protein n=1 Tax=uncultured Vibrio sp. TaxID=114054 RepID=UPI0025F98DF4|nr:BatD family protein [uncultured Vibrio sp.]
MGLLFSILMTCVVIAVNAQASELDIHDLAKSQDVELLAWVGDQTDSSNQSSAGDTLSASDRAFSVNEQIILTIEVATPRWLTGGTRIGSVEIPNVIAKQRNLLATNYTERKNGQTWSRQRWEVTLYPLTSGEFVIPRIPVQVQVSAPDGSNVTGTLYTQPIQFEASLPSGLLSDETPWFSATDVDVTQTWQQSNDELKVGDALTRTIEIKAKDSLSILLPDLLINSATKQYQAYPQPHQLDDTQERGDYRSSRIEESVYVIQQGGDFTLPSYQFTWWNSDTNTLENVAVEGKTFTATHTVRSFLHAYMNEIVAVIASLILMIFIVLSCRRAYRNRPVPEWLVFYRLTKAKEWPKLRTSIYRQLRMKTSLLELSPMSSKEQWQSDSIELQQGKQDLKLFKRLWRAIRRKYRIGARFTLPKALPELETVLNRNDKPPSNPASK